MLPQPETELMDQIRKDEPEGAPARAQNAGASAPSGGAGPERRFSARRKLAAVTRLLRGGPLEAEAVSQALSPATGRGYGLARVARVWQLSRATVYRHRVTDGAAAPAGPARRGPIGACSDAELIGHIR